MTTTTLTIDDHRITLREDADVSELAGSIVAAVREGGDFVHVDDARGQSYDVLITSHSRAMITQTEPALDTTMPDRGWTPSLELDF